MPDEWTSPASIRHLEPDEIQIWRLPLADAAGVLTEYRHILSIEEQARAERRLPGRVREEFVYGRACLRILLAENLGVQAASVQVLADEYGKPRLAGASNLTFNLSHSYGMLLVAMSWQGSVGVDVEHINPATEIMELAPSVFSSSEMDRLRSLSIEDMKRSSFYRTWTRKEAIIKADGRGLSIPLTGFDVPDVPAFKAAIRLMGKSYYLSDIAAGNDVVAAVAGESHNCRITLQDFPVSALK
jgi:4'-phosphopantetheinyl transferase